MQCGLFVRQHVVALHANYTLTFQSQHLYVRGADARWESTKQTWWQWSVLSDTNGLTNIYSMQSGFAASASKSLTVSEHFPAPSRKPNVLCNGLPLPTHSYTCGWKSGKVTFPRLPAGQKLSDVGFNLQKSARISVLLDVLPMSNICQNVWGKKCSKKKRRRRKKKPTQPLVNSLTVSLVVWMSQKTVLTKLYVSETDSFIYCHLWLLALGSSLVSLATAEIIPLYDFVVLPKWEITPSPLLSSPRPPPPTPSL